VFPKTRRASLWLALKQSSGKHDLLKGKALDSSYR
jgi:hypothetical protein